MFWFIHLAGGFTLLLAGFGIGWIWCDTEHDLRALRRSSTTKADK